MEHEALSQGQELKGTPRPAVCQGKNSQQVALLHWYKSHSPVLATANIMYPGVRV